MRCASETSRKSAPSPSKLQGRPCSTISSRGSSCAVEQLVGDLAGGRLVGQLERLGAEPLHADDRDQRVGQDAADGGVGLEIFEADHRRRPNIVLTLHFLRQLRQRHGRPCADGGQANAMELLTGNGRGIGVAGEYRKEFDTTVQQW